MKAGIAAGVAAALFVVLTLGTSADAEAAKSKRYVKKQDRESRPGTRLVGGKIERQIEYDAKTLPFGSSIWWEQMLRENRLTCCN